MRHPNHIGIAASTIDGAALFYRTLACELAKSPYQGLYPEVSTHTLPLPVYEDILQHKDWAALAEKLLLSINQLAKIGADFILLPANTLHFAMDSLLEKSPLPILNMLPLVVNRCRQLNYQHVAVLGTQLTMSEGLYQTSLAQAGIQTVSLTAKQQAWLHHFILQEVVLHKVTPSSLVEFGVLLHALQQKGCEAFILACNALPLLVQEQVFSLPFIDSTQLLAQAAIAEASDGKDLHAEFYSHLYRYW